MNDAISCTGDTKLLILVVISFLARLYESMKVQEELLQSPWRALMLKFLVKVFISQYLLNMWMDYVDTLHVGRYWSEVLFCTIMTHASDLEVKVTDLEILC